MADPKVLKGSPKRIGIDSQGPRLAFCTKLKCPLQLQHIDVTDLRGYMFEFRCHSDPSWLPLFGPNTR